MGPRKVCSIPIALCRTNRVCRRKAWPPQRRTIWLKEAVSPPATRLQVSEVLEEAARRQANAQKEEHRLVVRGAIVRDAIDGYSNEENGRRNRVSPDTVRLWRFRATTAEGTSQAFMDLRRSGRPPQVLMETRLALIQTACSRPAPELSHARLDARMGDLRTARDGGKRAAKCARARAARLAKREVTLRERGKRDALKRARAERRSALREAERADRGVLAAEAALASTRAAAVGGRRAPCFSAVWTHQTLQAELERQTGTKLSRSEIGRILLCGGLRPHRVQTWLHSPDPDFRAKARVICDLYVEPPPGVRVLCIDEKSGMTARQDLYPLHMPSRDQGRLRKEAEYVRHGTTNLIASLDVQTGEVFGRCMARTATGLVAFFEQLVAYYPEGEIVIICDNLNVHKGPLIDDFCARQGGRVRFVYTPLHASWVNQIEIWFSILQRKVLRHGSFSSPMDLVAGVMDYIRHWNTVERRPFRWRFRGDFVEPGVRSGRRHAQAQGRPDAGGVAQTAA